MIYKGTVIKEEKNYMVVLSKDCQYIKLKKKGKSQIGKEIMFIKDDIYYEEKIKYPRHIVAAAIIFFIITTTLIGGLQLNFIGGNNVYAIVSLDINPSLEYEINKDDIVRDVKAINDDGEKIISSEMVGMKIEDAIFLGINNAIKKKYITEDNDMVLISRATIKENNKNSSDLKSKVIEKINSYEKATNVKLVYMDSDKDDINKAKDNHMSVGKYKLVKTISERNKDISIEEMKKMKVTEIVNKNRDSIEDYRVKDNRGNDDKKNKGQDKKNNNNIKKDNKGSIREKEDKEDKKDDKLDIKNNKVNIKNNNDKSNNGNKENNKSNKYKKDKEDKKDKESNKKYDKNKDDKEKQKEKDQNKDDGNKKEKYEKR